MHSSKLHKENKETRIAKTILIKKYKIGRFTVFNIKTCYGAIVIKTMQY